MDQELQQMHQIRGNKEIFDTLANWYDEGKVETIIPRPLHYGVVVISEKEYFLFDRNEDITRFIWYKDDAPYAQFEYNVQTTELDNIGTVTQMQESEDVYKEFFYITSVYCGSMAFIINNVGDEEKVKVTHKGDQRIYELDLQNDPLNVMTAKESAQGQVMHQLTYGNHA